MIDLINKSAVSILVKKGTDILNSPYQPLDFTHDSVIDKYLNDLENYPHFFVLACVMDRQMKAEKAWKIPYFIFLETGDPNFTSFSNLGVVEIQKIFGDKKLHRFNKTMAIVFFKAVQRIKNNYDSKASLIWTQDYSCGSIMKRFRQFEGVGIKIASMATNILLREFKIPLKNKSIIDISPDVHIRRVFTRLGFIEETSTVEEIIYCAKVLNPDYPGVFDLPTWQIGRQWCKPSIPDCNNCIMTNYCKKKY